MVASTIDCYGNELNTTPSCRICYAEGDCSISELDDIDELVKKHGARLRRFVTGSTGDPDLAETVAQDTLLRAYNGRHGFRGDCSVSTWLTGIAINVTREHLRSVRFRFWRQVKTTAVDIDEMVSFLPSNMVSAERRLLSQERLKMLYEAVNTLSPHQRTVFMMKFVEEMSVDQIGTILEMRTNTVRTHLHRALKTIRTRLGEKQ